MSLFLFWHPPRQTRNGPFVYRLGRQVFILVGGVQFPYGLQLLTTKKNIMSGGHFDYQQHKMFEIAESIQSVIDRNFVEMTDEELIDNFIFKDQLENYPEMRYHFNYSPEVIEKFKEGVELIRKAYVYAHRIDWLISGDDSEKSFLKRLDEELNNLKTN